MNRIRKHHGLLLVAMLLVAVVGCGDSTTFENRYGASSGASGRTSLNGFSAFRSTFENAGYSSRELRRLTSRAQRTDVIVLIPTGPFAFTQEVKSWLDRWLKQGDKTLIYIILDSGNEREYWADAVALAPPNLRLEYRRRMAQAMNDQTVWRNNRNDLAANGWFTAKPNVTNTETNRISGEWADEFAGIESDSADKLQTEYIVVTAETPKARTANSYLQAPTGPNSPSTYIFAEAYRPDRGCVAKPLLSNSDGDAIVAQASADKWKKSKIIVVGGGSLLTNYAFTDPFRRKLADKIVESSNSTQQDDDRTVGFLTAQSPYVPVSDATSQASKSSGMELLMVWPISLVTIHAAILGVVFCMIIFPLFGRPKKLATKSTGNFGDHLDAVASLLKKTNDARYARKKISDYFRRIRGESTGRWVIDEQSNLASTPKPIRTTKPTNTTINSAASEGSVE